MGVAAKGLFTPLWSDRILEEWARAVARLGPEQEDIARGEILMLRVNWPKAVIDYPVDLEENLSLPDENDTHVLAAAIEGKADILLTQNTKDFPTRVLGNFGIIRRETDGFLTELFHDSPQVVAQVAQRVQQTAQHLSGQPQEMRKLMKKARLPRLGKALEML